MLLFSRPIFNIFPSICCNKAWFVAVIVRVQKLFDVNVFYFKIEQQINFGFKFSEIYTNKSKNLRLVPILSSYSGCRVTSNGIAGFKKCKYSKTSFLVQIKFITEH